MHFIAHVFRVMLLLGFTMIFACKFPWTDDLSSDGAVRYEFDFSCDGATANYIELDKISRISKFRSHVGHDYSDPYESNRSMKHYFVPRRHPVTIFSPTKGTVEYLTREWAGTQVGIRSKRYLFVIFHVSLNGSIEVGTQVSAGQELGTHVGSQTWSDIAVWQGDRLVSYFDVMADYVFEQYRSRGIASRSQMIISQEERDRDISISDWVNLN